MRTETLAPWLSIAGLVPFAAAVAAIWGGVSWLDGWLLLQSYGAIILSFLAGMHWGRGLGAQNIHAVPMLLWSNVIALIAWLTLLMSTKLMIASILFSCFTLQYLVDMRLARLGIMPHWFLPIRQHVTAGVLICCAMAIAQLLF